MRIDRLDLFSYGHLRGQTLDLSRPQSGLTLVLGPNEAGKSTTLRAITAVLFGIERGTADDHRMGRESLRVGAVLRDGAEDGDDRVVEVVRQGLNRAPLVAPDGTPVDESVLAALCGNVERSLFRALFCIDHDELHEHSYELLDPDADIGRLVFGASLGATALSQMLRDLESEADGLFRPRGSVQSVAKALAAARELKRRERDVRVRSRDYEQAERELARLEEQAGQARVSVGSLRAREVRLERLIAALPRLAQRSAHLDELAALDAAGPVQTAAWAESVAAVQEQLSDAEGERRRALAARDAVRAELAGYGEAGPLCRHAERFDDLLKGVVRFRKDRTDLPGLEGELGVQQDNLAGLLERLGMDERAARAVTEPHLATLAELADGRGALDAKATTTDEEVAALVASIAAARKELAGLPEARDLSGVAATLAVARTYLERERGIGRERVEVDQLAADVEAGARRLGLESLLTGDLESLPVPAAAEVREHRDRLAALEQRRREWRLTTERLESRERELQARRVELLAALSAPDANALATARVRRDEGWQIVRRAWLEDELDQQSVDTWAGGEPLADAYERSVIDADDQADERFASAEQLAGVARVDADLAELEEERREAADEARAVEAADGELAAAWGTLWQAVGVTPTGVDAGEEWLAQLAEVRRAAVDHRRRVAQLDEAARDVEQQRLALTRALGIAEPVPGSLALAVEQADVLIEEARVAAERARDKRLLVEQGEERLPAREEAAQRAHAALTAWSERWAAALVPLGLSPETLPAVGREVISLLREYRATLAAVETLRRRVKGLTADIADYADRVTALLEEAAPDLRRFEPDRALEELKPAVDAARRDDEARRVLRGQLDAAEDALREAESDVDSASAELARLRAEAGLGEDGDLAFERGRAVRYEELRTAVRELEDDLLRQGGGLGVDELVDAVAAEGGDEGELQAGLDAVRSGLEQESQAEADANREVGDAQARLRSLVHEGEAAALEQEAELEFAAVAGHVAEYARLALAAEVLRRVVADYGQRNQGPILELAAANFAALTDCAFCGLQVDLDGGRQLLLARRQNGEVLRLQELSEGTVDQLYLALRIAGLQHHLTQAAHNPPVILDDVLVNFDDERAAAALHLFAWVGRQAQVLLFTHHRHVRDLALEVLPPDVVHCAELAPRDHTAPSEAPDVPLSLGITRETRRAGANVGSDACILEVLREAGEPLGKAEVIARTGLSDADWSPAVRRLVDAGLVLREGAKRGAKYRPA